MTLTIDPFFESTENGSGSPRKTYLLMPFFLSMAMYTRRSITFCSTCPSIPGCKKRDLVRRLIFAMSDISPIVIDRGRLFWTLTIFENKSFLCITRLVLFRTLSIHCELVLLYSISCCKLRCFNIADTCLAILGDDYEIRAQDGWLRSRIYPFRDILCYLLFQLSTASW